VDAVEWPERALAQRLFAEDGISAEVSPYILRKAEALFMPPINPDLVHHHRVVLDPKGFFADLVRRIEALIARHPAERFPIGSGDGDGGPMR
jgi:hypothetical protein